MRRRFAMVALLVVATLVVPQVPAYAVAKGEIKGMSHNHPRDKNFSWVGVRVRATPGATVEVHLAGPAVVSTNPVKCRVPDSAEVLAVFKITAPGQYTAHLTVTKGNDSDSDQDSYTVPDPPRPRWGDFRFKKRAGCFKGWPTR